MNLPVVHYTAAPLLQPANPITLNLIGGGGTGSRLISLLAELNKALIALQHPGLQVRLFDDDLVTPANLYRQRFVEDDIGYNKAEVLITRTNRSYGTNWIAVPDKFAFDKMAYYPRYYAANMYISCVDSPQQRFFIAEILNSLPKSNSRNRGYYWLDLGNSKDTGQGVLATLGAVPQPSSETTLPVGQLPMVTSEFKTELEADEDKNLPSCSLAEALQKQNLYINAAIATQAVAFLQELITGPTIDKRGFFLNLKDAVCRPIAIQPHRIAA